MNINYTIVIAIVSIGVGSLLLYASWKGYHSTKNISNWEITQGTITKSSVKRAGAAFIPDMEYRYFVLGVEYKGISVTIPADIIYDIKVAQGLISEYPVGKKVDVFYNPKIYQIAVLEKESPIASSWIAFLIFCTALALLIFGFSFLFSIFQ